MCVLLSSRCYPWVTVKSLKHSFRVCVLLSSHCIVYSGSVSYCQHYYRVPSWSVSYCQIHCIVPPWSVSYCQVTIDFTQVIVSLGSVFHFQITPFTLRVYDLISSHCQFRDCGFESGHCLLNHC